MNSFFSSIQSHFKQEYHGRYIEKIITEVSNSSPNILSCLGKSSYKKLSASAEWSFKVGNKSRRSDIALFDSLGELKVLIEIKYNDHLSDKNDAQINDYLEYCKSNAEVDFVCLTAYHIDQDIEENIKRSGHKLLMFTDFANKIDRDDQLANLLYEYFKEQGLTMNTIDETLLSKLLKRLFNSFSGHGTIQKNEHMIDGIPETLSSLMRNLSLVSADLQPHLKSKRVSSMDFSLWPKYKMSNTSLDENSTQVKNSLIIEPSHKDKIGGTLEVFSRNSINQTYKGNNYIYLCIGFFLKIENGNEISVTCYAMLTGKFDKYDTYLCQKKIDIKTLSSKEKLLKHFKGLSKKSLDIAINDKDLKNNEYFQAHKKSLKIIDFNN